MIARTFGVYKERARSAVLVAVTLNPTTAAELAEQLSCTGAGPHLVAGSWIDHRGHHRGPIETIRYNDPDAPGYISRHGDYDTRTAWQPYPERRA